LAQPTTACLSPMISIELLRTFIFSLGYLIVVFSLIPLAKLDYWFVRVFDYPRSQKFWINCAILIGFLIVTDFDSTHDIVFAVLLTLNLVYLFSLIREYTPFASRQMEKNTDVDADSIKIFIANVYQDNTDSAPCIDLIKKYEPDVVLLVETNERWTNTVQEALGAYRYRVLRPQSNTYGMVLFSKLEIAKHDLRFLVEHDVPSITADIKTKGNQNFRLYCLHPRPPVPGESDTSTERDAEILIIGKEAKKFEGPVIVAGDLNDVAWSYTTNLFLKVSQLLDPRIGRGFYSTFHARYRLLRWPLDHVFCSSHFYLRQLKRLPTIGSDHFPIFIEVSLMPLKISGNVAEEKKATADERQLSEEKIQAAST
jgi:endonuclease/exonuclease/phosphatase (EEP) superfamily protein YafD